MQWNEVVLAKPAFIASTLMCGTDCKDKETTQLITFYTP